MNYFYSTLPNVDFAMFIWKLLSIVKRLVPDEFSWPPESNRPVFTNENIDMKKKKIVAYFKNKNNRYIPGPNCLNSSIDTKRLNFLPKLTLSYGSHPAHK
jgi:hypothetical protein